MVSSRVRVIESLVLGGKGGAEHCSFINFYSHALKTQTILCCHAAHLFSPSEDAPCHFHPVSFHSKVALINDLRPGNGVLLERVAPDVDKNARV